MEGLLSMGPTPSSLCISIYICLFFLFLNEFFYFFGGGLPVELFMIWYLRNI